MNKERHTLPQKQGEPVPTCDRPGEKEEAFVPFREIEPRLLHSFLATFLWGIIAHGYCYFNEFYSHDSLLSSQMDDAVNWQTTIGRYLQWAYLEVRGSLFPPALVGFLSLVFLALSLYGIVKIFDVKSKPAIWLFGGILTANFSVSLLNATYIHDADMYMLSLLFSVWSVYLLRQTRYGFITGTVCLFASLGLYQSYFEVAVFLFMMAAVLDILRQREFASVMADGLKAILMLVLSLAVYYVGTKLALVILGAEEQDSYNSISIVGSYGSLGGVLRAAFGTYKVVVQHLLFPVTAHSTVIGLVNVVFLLYSAWAVWLLVRRRKIRGKNLTLLLVLIALMPFGMNVVYFITNSMEGMVHELMLYALVLTYIFAALITRELCREYGIKPGRKRFCARLAAVLTLAVILDGVIYSNQVYLKKDLEYQTTLLTMNRIIDRIEQIDGYEIGQTPVVFVGLFSDSQLSQGDREYFDYTGTGLWSRFAISNETSLEEYFQLILNYPILLQADDGTWSEREEVKAMSPFPASDSCRMIDGVIVVKLSD